MAYVKQKCLRVDKDSDLYYYMRCDVPDTKKFIKQKIQRAINYITNPEKTTYNGEQLVYCNGLYEAKKAGEWFTDCRVDKTNRSRILLQHIIISFKKDEIFPNDALDFGVELASRFGLDKYQYVAAVHNDKEQVHVHIMFNHISYEDFSYYQASKRAFWNLRALSDQMCKEYELSTISDEYRQFTGKYNTRGASWWEYLQKVKGISWKSKLQKTIDRNIYNAKTYDEFLSLMEKSGYEVITKTKAGNKRKHIAFRCKIKDKNGKSQERVTRASTIGDDYTEDRIKERIAEEQSIKDMKQKMEREHDYSEWKRMSKLDLNKIIDTDKEKFWENYYLKRWAENKNLTTASETVVLMRKMNLTYDALKEKVAKMETEVNYKERQAIFRECLEECKKDIEMLNTMHRLYYVPIELDRIKDTEDFDNPFLKTYKKEIDEYNVALDYLIKRYGCNRIPSMKELLKNYEDIEEYIKDSYGYYFEMMEEYEKLKHILDNYEAFMGYKNKENTNNKEKTQSNNKEHNRENKRKEKNTENEKHRNNKETNDPNKDYSL